MSKKLFALAVLCVAGGCGMCSNSCDYSPVVPGGPPIGPVRSGSNSSGGVYSQPAANTAVAAAQGAAPSIAQPSTTMVR
jgi:hypothetical protein